MVFLLNVREMFVGMCSKTIASLDRLFSLTRSAVYAGEKVFSRDFLSVDENVLCLHRGPRARARWSERIERVGRQAVGCVVEKHVQKFKPLRV